MKKLWKSYEKVRIMIIVESLTRKLILIKIMSNIRYGKRCKRVKKKWNHNKNNLENVFFLFIFLPIFWDFLRGVENSETDNSYIFFKECSSIEFLFILLVVKLFFVNSALFPISFKFSFSELFFNEFSSLAGFWRFSSEEEISSKMQRLQLLIEIWLDNDVIRIGLAWAQNPLTPLSSPLSSPLSTPLSSLLFARIEAPFKP